MSDNTDIGEITRSLPEPGQSVTTQTALQFICARPAGCSSRRTLRNNGRDESDEGRQSGAAQATTRRAAANDTGKVTLKWWPPRRAHRRAPPSTVSRILNGTAVVSDDKRAAVDEAIARLKFVPSPVARGLAGGRTLSVGVVTPAIDGPFYGGALRGIEDQLGKAGSAADRLVLQLPGPRSGLDARVQGNREDGPRCGRVGRSVRVSTLAPPRIARREGTSETIAASRPRCRCGRGRDGLQRRAQLLRDLRDERVTGAPRRLRLRCLCPSVARTTAAQDLPQS